MITFHHANTRRSRVAQGSGLHIFASLKQLSSTCHVSYLAAPERRSVAKNELLEVPGGPTRVGRSWSDPQVYGWDNEFGEPTRFPVVRSFRASKFLVSNAEFHEFVERGGYSEPRWWSDEGWSWCSGTGVQHPRFWRRSEDAWSLRTLASEVPMPWDWPAEVNQLEGEAFCNWKAEQLGVPLRLPTEEEYLRLRDLLPADQQTSAHGPAWERGSPPGNVNLEAWCSACPVDHFVDASGFGDIVGNVWQHSVTPMDGFPGFKTHPLYEDFTTPTFDGLHARILGGSFMSTGANGALRDSRYAFRRHFYQHAGVRYVEGVPVPRACPVPYESDRDICSSLRFHFHVNPMTGSAYPAELAARTVAVAKDLNVPLGRVLELGCGAGRTSVELSGRFGAKEVVATDLSARFFEHTAQRLIGAPARVRWMNVVEGDHVDYVEQRADDLACDADFLRRVKDGVRWVQVPDPAEIDVRKIGTFDIVVAAQPQVLRRMPDLAGFLAHAHTAVRPGGVLILGSTEDRAGEDLESLRAGLEPRFEQVHTEDLPYSVQETARKFSYCVQRLTVWRRSDEATGTPVGVPYAPPPLGVSQNEKALLGQEMYNDAGVLDQYLRFHFGEASPLGVENFPRRCAELCIEAATELGVPLGAALELGGGPGRTSFELARKFEWVQGTDYSQVFVDAAHQLCRDGSLDGVALDQLGIDAALRQRVTFDRADACALPDSLRGYDLVCGFNLIDRLPDPEACLADLPTRVNPGGLLVLASPYTWLETFTPKNKWLGGFKYGDNDSARTYDALQELLSRLGFVEAKRAQDVEFVIQESPRTFQRTRAQMTFWRKPE